MVKRCHRLWCLAPRMSHHRHHVDFMDTQAQFMQSRFLPALRLQILPAPQLIRDYFYPHRQTKAFAFGL